MATTFHLETLIIRLEKLGFPPIPNGGSHSFAYTLIL
ncbi:hypothetical protein SAMN05216352_11311 [Alteribacillus bidgolensis]|uniref:Uncharacterized protein n=1 Tax=Alteribacillus bidgolensis TaxID=930129 RepID=A0A1G8NW41_9BACI|nr:hypothetical protein SAMN05216352_11311 [Alteribacillus bidgolensis]